MSSGYEQHEAGHHGDHSHGGSHGPRTLPAVLNSPEILSVWRTRALIVFAAAAIVSLVFAFTPEGRNHILRAYLLGFMCCFAFAGGGLVMLMLQYVTGGKWGLLLRRPLEAMSRTLPLVALMIVPIFVLAKHLYQWARYPSIADEQHAAAMGWITKEQELTDISKHTMFNPTSAVIQTVIIFGVLMIFMYLLNKWSLERDADPNRGTLAS